MPVDDRGICSFLVDETVVVNIGQEAHGDQLVLFAPLGQPPTERRADWQARMLRANGAGSGSYVLGMAIASDTAILSSRRALCSLNGPTLASWVAEFIEVAKYWMQAFAGGAEPGTPSAAMPLETRVQGRSRV
jgi:hypothetical protein